MKKGQVTEKVLIKKQEALDLMLSGSDKKGIAKQMGVALSTIQRWFRDPLMRDAFLEGSKDTIAEIKKVLMKDIIPISESLVDIALNAKNVRLRYEAGRHILAIFGIQPPKVSIAFEKKQIIIMKGILKE